MDLQKYQCVCVCCKPLCLYRMFTACIYAYINERDPPPWYAVYRRILDNMQYAKGRYAVHQNTFILSADDHFYFKTVHISSRNTTKLTFYFTIFEIKHIIGKSKNTYMYQANAIKLTIARRNVPVHATNRYYYSL